MTPLLQGRGVLWTPLVGEPGFTVRKKPPQCHQALGGAWQREQNMFWLHVTWQSWLGPQPMGGPPAMGPRTDMPPREEVDSTATL
ncbi:hypothetical protein CapIbe_009959 [Capra ibex]